MAENKSNKSRSQGKKSTASLQQIDAETGEILEGTVVLIPRKKKIELHGGWVAMSQPAMQMFAQIKTLEAQRVLWALLSRLDYENYILVNQAEICEELNIKAPNVSRAMRYLADQQILIAGKKVGRSLTYRFNPAMGWKGTAVNHSKALSERMEAASMTLIKGGKV